MVRVVALIACLSLGACTPATSGDGTRAASRQSAGQPWSVSFYLNSWGRPIGGWTVKSDGTGDVTRTSNKSGNFNEVDVQSFHLRMDAATLAKFVEASDRLKAATHEEVKCALTITDMPYGEIVWHKGAEAQTYKFNFGCTSPQASAVYDMMKQADQVVNNQSRIDAQPYEVRHLGNR